MSLQVEKILAIFGLIVLAVGVILGFMSYNDQGNANFNNDQSRVNEAIAAEISSVGVMLLGLAIITTGLIFKK